MALATIEAGVFYNLVFGAGVYAGPPMISASLRLAKSGQRTADVP